MDMHIDKPRAQTHRTDLAGLAWLAGWQADRLADRQAGRLVSWLNHQCHIEMAETRNARKRKYLHVYAPKGV